MNCQYLSYLSSSRCNVIDITTILLGTTTFGCLKVDVARMFIDLLTHSERVSTSSFSRFLSGIILDGILFQVNFSMYEFTLAIFSHFQLVPQNHYKLSQHTYHKYASSGH